MTRDKLEALLAPFTNAVNGGVLSSSKCMAQHVDLLLGLRAQGVPLDLIISISGIPYNKETFSVTLSQLKRKRGTKDGTSGMGHIVPTPSSANIINSVVDSKPLEIQVGSDTSFDSSGFDNLWGFDIGNNVIPIVLEKFKEKGITPENFPRFKEEHGIHNSKTLLRVLNSIRKYE